MTCAIVLAGGLGTRLRSLVSDVPKPMAPINGRPFLSYLLDYWIAQGVSSFVISVGYKHEAIIGYFGKIYKGTPIKYAVEPFPLGTGGGLCLAFELLNQDEPFLLLNGDTFFSVDLNALLHFAHERNADWCISLFKTLDIDRYMGVNLSKDSRILSLKGSYNGIENMANGGVYVINPRTLMPSHNKLGNKFSIEEDLIAKEIKRGKNIVGYSSDAFFIDIGVPSDYQRAIKYFAN